MAAITNSQAPPTSDPSVVARLASKRDKWKAQATTLAEEKAAAEKAMAALRTELDDLKKAAPADRIKELETELRTTKHRATFDRIAKAAGAKDKALDTLYRESGYQAEGDEPDPKAMEAALEALRDSHDFAFDDEEGDQAEGDDDAERTGDVSRRVRAEAKPAPDTGRGGRHKPAGTIFLTREQLADPKFMLNPKNADLIKTAKVRA